LTYACNSRESFHQRGNIPILWLLYLPIVASCFSALA
jgi:hypothetical protein